jgi:hypothetical protein
MEVVFSSKTSTEFQQTVRRYIQDDSTLDQNSGTEKSIKWIFTFTTPYAITTTPVMSSWRQCRT